MRVLMTEARASEDAKEVEVAKEEVEVAREAVVAEEVAREQEETPDWGDDDSANKEWP